MQTSLYRVLPGKVVFFPDSVGSSGGDAWGMPGQLLDISHPIAKEMIRGQEYKLEPLPLEQAGSAAVVGVAQWPSPAQAMVARYDAAKAGKAPPTKAEKAEAKRVQPSDLAGLDAPPAKPGHQPRRKVEDVDA